MPETISDAAISGTEIDAFAEKLAKWGSGLPTREQVLLQAILAEAYDGDSEEPSDVEGYGRRGGDYYHHHYRDRYRDRHKRSWRSCGGRLPDFYHGCRRVLYPAHGCVKPRHHRENYYYFEEC